jgi:hypothetical protein
LGLAYSAPGPSSNVHQVPVYYNIKIWNFYFPKKELQGRWLNVEKIRIDQKNKKE